MCVTVVMFIFRLHNMFSGVEIWWRYFFFKKRYFINGSVLFSKVIFLNEQTGLNNIGNFRIFFYQVYVNLQFTDVPLKSYYKFKFALRD